VGDGEQVPEAFLRRFEDDEMLAAHVGGVLLHQPAAPKFWAWDHNRLDPPGRKSSGNQLTHQAQNPQDV